MESSLVRVSIIIEVNQQIFSFYVYCLSISGTQTFMREILTED